MTFKIWEVDVPEKAIGFEIFNYEKSAPSTTRSFEKSYSTVQQIIGHDGDDIHKTFEHEDLLHGFQFLADMINRLFFLLIVVAEIIAFSATILTTMPASNSDIVRLKTVRLLELDACEGKC